MQQIVPEDFHLFNEFNAIFFSGINIVVHPNNDTPFIKFNYGLKNFLAKISAVFLQHNILFVDLEDTDRLCELSIHPSKLYLGVVSSYFSTYILRGIQWLTWSKRHQYCSSCGHPISVVDTGMEKKCTSCNISFFPNLSPAVMVLIKKGSEILLGRSPHFNKGMYSALAGFIELGETAECAAHREVAEEVNLKITSLKYFASQSWPFPSSFMIAFTAEYLSGTIKIDPHEIEDAEWFTIDKLPDLPPASSISRKLIDATVDNIKMNI